MEIRKLTPDDMDTLIQLRIDFTLRKNVRFTSEELDDLKEKSAAYFTAGFRTDSFIAYAAEENGEVQSAAFMGIADRPPRQPFTPFRAGTIYNVLTYPKHRRKGLSTKVLSALFEEAKDRGVSSIDLLATEDGKKVYEQMGFTNVDYYPMRLEL